MTTQINNENKKLNFSNEREQSQACLNSAEHEKNQGRKVLNVPNLRFPEFQGEWEKKSLGEIGDSFIGLTYKPTDVVSEGGLIVFRSSNIQNGCMDYKDIVRVNKNVKEKLITKKDDLLVCARNGSARLIGKNAILHEADANQTFGAFMMVFRSDKNHFVHQLLNTRRYSSQVSENLGARINQITSSDLSSFEFFFPTENSEMNKIAALLDLLDERIATQNKIIEDLKRLKSAIIEKVFCSPNQEYPMCRIEGFEQALSTYKMSDFSSRIATKNKDSKCSLVLTIAAQYGLVNQEFFFNKSVASENLTGYYLLHKGEFAYNRSYSAGYDWGAVKRLDNYDEGVLSTLYICFKINETIVDSDYLTYYFESTKWHRGLSDIAGEGARNHGLLNVSMADYFNTKHRFPVIEEQKAIVKILNAITEKERKATLLGECYQKQKQYLLCQMFT